MSSTNIENTQLNQLISEMRIHEITENFKGKLV